MDKNVIKKYAIWARRELIVRVTQKAEQYEITEKKSTPADADSIGGRVLTAVEKKQRQSMINKINQDGFAQVIEEVAYTWFNRFTALRFMEVNNYLPSHTRVFTNENGEFKPQILADAIELDLDGLDMDKVYELKNTNKMEELYKYLLIIQCNALSAILPRMFQKIEDCTELLLPDYLLREGSVIQQMIELIPEDDWKDAVQIIGWLYQYYNSEKKDDVFAALKKNVKITKENIPAATQLFTPDWIVRYMVENSLGRLWLEGHPDTVMQLLPTEEEQSAYVAGNCDPEDSKWHYYLEEVEQEPEVQEQLSEIRKEYAALTPDQLKVSDPCSGSGHILVYMFDVLMKIYESYGYNTREAVVSIVENNLYGLDIDGRAAQLAYFAVMMKARQYDRRFFSCGIQPHVYAIVESNHVDKFAVDYFCNGDAKLKEAMDTIISELYDAKEYGSILTITPQDWSALYERFAEITEDTNMFRETALRELLPLVQEAEALAQKYDVMVTNPPYMVPSSGGNKLNGYVKKEYPNSKADMFSVFIECCNKHIRDNGLQAMITQHSWMFLSSFEKQRELVLLSDVINMIHLGAHSFEEIGGEVVQTTAFCLRKNSLKEYKATYCRLIQGDSQDKKEKLFLQTGNRFYLSKEILQEIPGCPFAYWLSKNEFAAFSFDKLFDVGVTRRGLQTGNRDRFIRYWFELKVNELQFPKERVDNYKWIIMNNGGNARKWYGEITNAVLWGNNGEVIKSTGKAIIPSEELYFKECITWNRISVGKLSVKYQEQGIIQGDMSPFFISYDSNMLKYIMAFMNSAVSTAMIHAINPTITMPVGDIAKLPVKFSIEWKEKIDEIVQDNISISKVDWDSFETSWDFQYHPLLRKVLTIAEAFEQWQSECDGRFNRLKANEEELNRIFIDIYGLQDELTPEVEDRDVTVRKADLQRDIRSLISYAVGCMFGRYSIYKPGLLFAGEQYSLHTFVDKLNDQPNVIMQDQLIHEYIANGIIVNKMFEPDCDNIIPICDDEYFEDDIVGRFIEFIETVYGKDTLEENLKFIADALGSKGTSREIIRNYFINEFYNDHCKVYQKCPIYWLFDSGKKNGFKCLIYMHRYQPDTIARIRTDYVHEQQSRYRTAIADLEQRINGASTSERVKLNKQLTKLQAQAAELREYEEKIHHLADQMIGIDLDDGVKVNYAKFQDVLAKIK